MEDEGILSFVTIIKNLILAYIKRLNDIVHLATLETKLAVKTLVTIIILFCIFTLLIFSTWLSAQALIFIYLVSLHYSMLASAFILMMLNLLFICIVLLTISRIKNNLFFPATRRQIANATNEETRIEHERTTKAN